MTITFKNGDYIIYDGKSNTFYGDFSHKIMHIYNQTCRNSKVEPSIAAWTEFYNKIVALRPEIIAEVIK